KPGALRARGHAGVSRARRRTGGVEGRRARRPDRARGARRGGPSRLLAPERGHRAADSGRAEAEDGREGGRAAGMTIDTALDVVPAPFDAFRDRVRPEWIDANGHLNMAYYVLVFDYATDAWFEHVGLGGAHRVTHGVTTFCLEAHVTYHHEVKEG